MYRTYDHHTDTKSPRYLCFLFRAVRLVLASLERGSRQHVDTLDVLFDLASPIYSFCREENMYFYTSLCLFLFGN